MGLEDILKSSESAEQLINDLAKAFREKRWVKILSFAGVVSALLLNPPAVEYGLKLLGYSKLQWYSYRIWLIFTAGLFVAAFLVALLTRKRQETETAPVAVSIIKGLLPYTSTKEDVEWFARLQRGNILQECMNFCLGKAFSFAILSGESGTGKTSFLQAGLSPNLAERGYRPVFVKFTDSPPLDSIRHALNGNTENTTPDDPQSLLKLLHDATENDKPTVILILDQFEQFFAHHKSKPSRKPFIQQMAEWHKQRDALHAKILVSIRGDFADRLIDFQREMQYALTAQNMLRMEKFEPQEAANVINVIAREAKIEFDEGFIEELTKHELADREEGTVSSVDIQILSWMIDGQKNTEERAFNRRAFQKLGGVEGLLERFLNRQLSARETDARRKAAIQVMLALTDQNVRAGALALKDLKEKLAGIIPGDDVEEAVSWLAKSEVRLVTPIQEKNVTLYELSHERLIQPLRRLAFQEITDVERAQQALDRRVNEWVGNNRARRYLLTFKEWRLIERYRALINLSAQKEQKEEFISLSKRRFVVRGLIPVVALLLGVGAYAVYKWYERRPETQISNAQKRLVELLARNKDFSATSYATLLLSVLESGKDQELSQQLWQRIYSLSGKEQAVTLKLLAEAYNKLPVPDEAAKSLDKLRQEADRVRQEAEKLDPSDRVEVLHSLAETYSKLPNTEAALDGLDKILGEAERLDPSLQESILPSIASGYSELSSTDGALKNLDKILDEAKNYDVLSSDGDSYLLSLAQAYSNLSKTDEALNGLEKVRESAGTHDDITRAEVWVALTPAYSKLSRSDEAIKELNKIFDEAGKHPVSEEMLLALARAYSKLPNTDAVVDRLDKIQQMATALNDDSSLSFMLGPLAEAYGKLSNTDEALNRLDKIQSLYKKFPTESKTHRSRSRVLTKLIEVYGKLNHLDKIQQAAEQSYDGQGYLLLPLAEAYGKLPNAKTALDGLDKILDRAENLDPEYEENVLLILAKEYGKLPQTNEALNRLGKVQQVAETLSSNRSFDRARVLLSVAREYIKLSKTDEAAKILDQEQQEANAMPLDSKTSVLIDVATLDAKMSRWREAVEAAQSIGNEVSAISALSRVLIIWKDANNGTKNMDALDDLFQEIDTQKQFL